MALLSAGYGTVCAAADPVAPSETVLQAEARRIEMMERVSPSVVCLFDSSLRGGGSGVLIDPDGYGLTNFHVVAAMLKSRRGWGGLGDGILYELEVLGIDVTGDVAMFRLIPPKDGYRFPYAKLGDSDRVRVGDTAIAMGNPFMLSEDHSPTITLGIVTGVHRYQWGVQGNLAYTDCIQVDAPINPGNSGGPLFSADGEVIGINGRISVNTRGRFNVGFGYAISANQIKRFMPALRAGLLAKHGAWQARVDETNGAIAFTEVKRSGPTYDAGIRTGDKLLTFDGVAITSTNQVASLLGTYPQDWPIVLGIDQVGKRRDVVVRLDAVEPSMPAPFEVDSEINHREVRRVLRGFQEAVFDGAVPRRIETWKWTVTRIDQSDRGGRAATAERYDATLSGDEPVRMRQRHDDGSPGRIIEYDEQTATQRLYEPPARAGDNASARSEAFDLTPDAAMTLGALYVMQRRLLSPVTEMDLRNVVHAGADAMLPGTPLGGPRPPTPDPPVSPLVEGSGVGGLVTRKILEVIEWPLNERTLARFEFDADTRLLRRIRVRDGLVGTTVELTLSDYCDIGGLSWPSTIEVSGPGYAYENALADWEIAP